MLLFNRIRNNVRSRNRTETGTQATAVPGADNGDHGGRNDEASHPRRSGSILRRVAHVPLRWRRHRDKSTHTAPSAPDMQDPMVSFSPVTANALDGAVLHDEVPDIIANKIQKHHELWYHLAYGRPRDRRVTGGYALQPARLGGRPLPRPNPKNSRASGLTHIASWRTRPMPWSEAASPDVRAGGAHRPITSIDYGNADEVVLSHTQEVHGDMLKADDTLPEGSPKYMIHPYNKRKVMWDLFVAVLIVYGCINIPLRIGFDLPTSLGQLITDSFIDVAFLSDMVLSFRTAYLAPDGEPVTVPRDIAIRYLKGSFLIDLCSTIPVDLIMLAVGGTGSLLRSTKLLRTLRLLRLARLMKLSKIGGKEDDLKNFLHPSLWALIKMLVSLIFIAHIMGCMWNWLTILLPDGQNWAISYGVADTTWGHRYLVGVYWAFTTMTTVGYGDITSANDLERGFAIVGMIIGATVFGYIIGNVAVIMENFNVVDAIENGKMNQIKDWLYDRKFPPALADKIRRQYRYIFTEVGVFDNTEILDVMPGVMATSLIYAQHRAVAKGVGFLAQRPPVLVSRLLRKMVPCFANSGDVLYLEHEVGGHWYILRAGTISFYVSVSPLETQSEVLLMRTLSEDGNFGLTPVILNVLNSETATAISAAELLTVRKDDLIDLLRQWPEVMAELTTEAEKHFEEVKKFRLENSGGIQFESTSLSSRPKLSTTKSSNRVEAAVCASIDGRDTRVEAGEIQAGGDNLGSKGGGSNGTSLFFRGDETKQAEDCDGLQGGVDASNATNGSIPGGIKPSVEAAAGENGFLPVASEEQLASATVYGEDGGDEEEGGGGNRSTAVLMNGDRLDRANASVEQSPARHISSSTLDSSSSSDDIDTASGKGSEEGRGDGGGEGEKERREARRAAAAAAVAAGAEFDEPEKETKIISATTAADAVVAAAATAAPVVAATSRGRPAEKLRPPPITTSVVPSTLGKHLQGINGDDDSGKRSNNDDGDPEKMRACFVAKTFSPSDLGLGLLPGGGGIGGDGVAREVITKASLMKNRRRRRTINPGTTSISGHRGSVDEVLGLDDEPGSVPPERLFSVTGMFHPEAPIKVSWDLWLSTVIVWSVLEITYRLGFDRPAQGGWVILSYCVDGLFFTDMLVSLRTALVKRDGEVVAKQKEVTIAYLKGWFLVDLVSTVPWDLLVLKIAVGNPSAATSTKLVRALRLVRLVRLIRLLKIPDFMEEWEDNSPLGPSSVKLGRLLVIMAFSAHINACIWYAAGLHTSAESNWITDYYCSGDGVSGDCPDSKQSFSLYLTSIYFAFTTMTTTGYGDILPNPLSKLELIVAIASEVLGATIFAWVIGNLVNLVLNLNPAERNRKSMMSYLTEYIRDVPLSSKAKQSMARNYAFHLQIHSVFNQPSILGDLLPHLQNQAYIFLWRSLMPKLPFLCAMEDQVTGFMRVVLPLLKPATFSVGELIVTPKIGTREMGFILSGEVEVRLAKRRHNFKTMAIGERQYFGEIFMLLPEHVPFRGLAQVRATSRVRMMTLTRNAFSMLEDRHPHISDFMAKQLYDPTKTPQWVVVSADFQSEVDKLEANTLLSDSHTLQTPRSPEGSFLSQANPPAQDLYSTVVTSPGGSIQMRKRTTASRSPSTSPIGVAAPKEPAMRQAVGVTQASRMASSGRGMPPHGR